MSLLDRRLIPARPDIAAEHLRGKVHTARFVAGEWREVVEPTAPLRREPRPDAPLDTEALLGERVTVYETNEEGWSWGQLEDGYVGWLPTGALGDPAASLTHRVSALRTLVFPGPSIKLPPVMGLSLGARLAIIGHEGPLAKTASGGFVSARHLAPIATTEDDFVAVAERFVGVPYLWGGKTSLGLDCSGLVQVALNACGIACPRDSDLQERSVGDHIVTDTSLQALRRGDLVFWKGHVAIARDATSLVHANAFHMSVATEPIGEALARIRASGSEVTSVRRLDRVRTRSDL